MQTTKKSWDTWELIAIKYLQNAWYKILETNYKFGRFWEIDIIAKLENKTVFIEVKYRSNFKFWTGEESITPYKLKKLEKTLYSYCFMNGINIEDIRFDVITIMKWQSSYKVKHYKNLEI